MCVGSWVLASELCESGQRGDVHICESREGGVQFCSGYFIQAGTVAIGDWDSGCGIAGTVAIGDRDSGGEYRWDSAEGLGQQARVLRFYRRRMLRLCELTWKGCSKKKGPRKRQIRNTRRSWRDFGRKGRWAHPSAGKVVVVQLISGELLLGLWFPYGRVG